MHHLLFYDVVEGYAERRLAFRAAHLAQARDAVAGCDSAGGQPPDSRPQAEPGHRIAPSALDAIWGRE